MFPPASLAHLIRIGLTLTTRTIATCLLLALFATTAQAQPAVSSVQPRAATPGQTVKLNLTGKGFSAALRGVTSHAGATLAFEATEAEKTTLVVTVPADAPLGPMGIWLAGDGGAAEPIVVLVDDLPSVADGAANTSIATAQGLTLPVAVDGASRGAAASLFKFDVAAGQRVAFEILTQPIESAMDPVLRLLDPAGKTIVLADDDAIGPDCRFAHTFQAAGTYFIEVRDNRFTAGGSYRLRVGDFPILTVASPLAVTAGQKANVKFQGPDGAAAEAHEFAPAADHPDGVTTIATRLPGGKSSAWVPIRVTGLPTHVAQTGVAAEPITPPAIVSGHIASSGARERIAIRGTKGTTVRFQALARSLGSAALPRMRLLGEGDAVLAENPVNDADEWALDHAFAADGVFQLEIADLLGRGGDDFGFAIQMIPAGTFAAQVKPDAKIAQQFPIEAAVGAMAVDLVFDRFGYDGEIEIVLDPAAAGLRVVNPKVPAGAKEAKITLAADENWKPEAFAKIGLKAQAAGNPAIACVVDSLGLQRAKKPHVPFPIRWNRGAMSLAGVAAAGAYYTLQPEGELRLAAPLAAHTIALPLKRTDAAFKGAVTLIPDQLPSGWTFEVKAEGDNYTTTWKRTAEAPAEPAALNLLAYTEHNGRGRIEKLAYAMTWYQPLGLSIEPVAASAPVAPGSTLRYVAKIKREGGEPQAVTLTFTPATGAASTATAIEGVKIPEPITIAPDKDSAEFAVELAADIATTNPPSNLAGGIQVALAATTMHQGQAMNVAASLPTITILANPTAIDVFPMEMMLVGNRDRHQIVVTGTDSEGIQRDWTRLATLTSADPKIAEVRGTTVFAIADGETKVAVQAGDKRYEIPVRVTQTGTPWKIRFESEVLVALSKQGCNSGACHGSPSGKGMFRLSLRAFDAKLDAYTLVREESGRRLNVIEPDSSLLLQKPLMKVYHGGGKKIHKNDEAYAVIRDWIAQGGQLDPPETPRCVRLEVAPSKKRVLRLEDGPQQLAAVAHFADGTKRDVTHLVAYESSDKQVADVDAHGLVTPAKRGEAVILVRFLEHIESVPLMFIQQIPEFVWNNPPENNYVDELVNAKLQQLKFVPAPTCSDSEFIRRVHLDLVGILPPVEKTREFLADAAPDKRAKLIDELLERDEFAKFWALKWGDLLKMTGKLVGTDGIYKYHRWVEEAFRTNMPYDKFARALLTTGGSTLANPPANFYRTATDMNECVENISQVFLGARLQCAKCHNHPFERWTQDNYYGLGAFFNRIQRKNTQRPGEMFVWHTNTGEVTQPRTGATMKPWAPVVGSMDLPADVDRRFAFADWLIAPDNPFFAKMEVNRIWAQLFTRGIVDPIDDFRDSNPPSNESLLETLAKDFVASGFDRKHILRVMLNSRTYQASYLTTPLNKDDAMYFSHQQPRLLSAEQLLDAINQAVGIDQTFGGFPAGTKATHLPAPDLVKIDFLKVFGQPERTTVCACERVDDSNLGMAIELFNGPTIHEKLRAESTRFKVGLAAGKAPKELIEELYLAAFCRRPSDEEAAAAIAHVASQETPQAALEDIAWALLNTDEFLFQH